MRSVRGLSCAVVAAIGLFGSVAGAAVVLNTVSVGDPGNVADTAHASRGSVAYPYQVSKYEITNNQYCEFLNTVDPTGANTKALWVANMGSAAQGNGGITQTLSNPAGSIYAVKPGQGNQPVVFVSPASGMRMANWMQNGQGTGSTESGAYDMTQAQPVRGPGASIAVANLNEWWKAAYYDPNLNSGSGGYWTYATASNTAPNNPAPPTSGTNDANYKGGNATFAVTGTTGSTLAGVDYLSNVGAYSGSVSAYGTYDQNGNANEWVDDLIGTNGRQSIGGGFSSSNSTASFGTGATLIGTPNGLTVTSSAIGFRLALVPEPTLSLIPLIVFGAIRRRRA